MFESKTHTHPIPNSAVLQKIQEKYLLNWLSSICRWIWNKEVSVVALRSRAFSDSLPHSTLAWQAKHHISLYLAESGFKAACVVKLCVNTLRGCLCSLRAVLWILSSIRPKAIGWNAKSWQCCLCFSSLPEHWPDQGKLSCPSTLLCGWFEAPWSPLCVFCKHCGRDE